MGDHLASEAVDERQVDGQVERATSTGEVLVELAGDVVESRRSGRTRGLTVSASAASTSSWPSPIERDPDDALGGGRDSSVPSGLSTVR